MNLITQVALPLILAFIMFSMGLTLGLADFKRVATFPRAFLIGTVLQLVSLPLLAFTIAAIFLKAGYITPAVAAGLIIISACPGGVTSNLMTHISRGDTALSISLTAVISVVSVFTIPPIVNLGLSHFMGAAEAQLPLLKTVVGVFAITTLPVLMGMALRARAPEWTARNEPKVAKLSAILLLVVIVAAIAKDWRLLRDSFAGVGPLTLSLNLVTMMVAYGVARLLRLDRPQSVAITFECGLQNGGMAIFISLTLLESQEIMIPCGVYSLLMMVTGTMLMGFFARVPRPEPALAP